MKRLTDAQVATFVEIRHALYRDPELGFQEHRTAARVAELLRGWDYQVTEDIGGTGVLGQPMRGQGGHTTTLLAHTFLTDRSEATV